MANVWVRRAGEDSGSACAGSGAGGPGTRHLRSGAPGAVDRRAAATPPRGGAAWHDVRVSCRAAFAVGALVLGLATRAACAAVDVPVEIDLRAEIAAGRFDPGRDAVGVRGSRAPLAWDRSVIATPQGDGRYGLALRFERVPFGGQPVQYKFRIERPGEGPDQGWERGPNRTLRLDAPRPRIARAFGEATDRVPPRRTGTIERLGIVASRHVPPRAVQVWLPPGYARQPALRHPVLYLHDGQNVFDDQAAGAEWQMDETAQRLVEQRAIAPPILVAIDSGPDRIADYTPSRGVVRRSAQGEAIVAGGGAAAYARFVVEELKPLIDRRYRTRVDAASTAVGGSSLAAVLSLWLVLHHGDTFGSALVVSPAAWWDDEFARRDVLALDASGGPRPRVWLDVGANEGTGAVPAARRLRDALRSRGWSDATLAWHEDPDGGHDEASWAARGEAMLRFLYAVER